MSFHRRVSREPKQAIGVLEERDETQLVLSGEVEGGARSVEDLCGAALEVDGFDALTELSADLRRARA
jgi:hypothetical protein